MLNFSDVLIDIDFSVDRKVQLRPQDRSIEISLTDAEFNKFKTEISGDEFDMDLSDIRFDPKDMRIEQLEQELWILKRDHGKLQQELTQIADLGEENQKINLGLLNLLKAAKAVNVQLTLEVESWVEQVKRERGVE